MNDKLTTFLIKYKENKCFPPKDERFPLLLKNTQSKIFPAYIEFSLSLCRDIEPFLKLFQSERPLAVFLFRKLKELVVSMMERFVRSDVLQANASGNKFLGIDLKKDENFVSLASINVGFGAKAVLRKLATTEKTLEREFRKGAQALLIRLIEKLIEKCPLKYKLTRAISSLPPIEVSSLKPGVLKQRFALLVNLFHDFRLISSVVAEKAEKQYSQLISNSDFLKEAKKFCIIDDRVDDFYSRIIDSPTMVDLENVTRLVLILSHGNARVESGFSINSSILLENMLKETIVSQRLVYEGIHRTGGSATDVAITPEMLKMVKASHKRFKAAQEEKRRHQSEGQKRLAMKRKMTLDVKKAVASKKAIVEDLQGKIHQFDAEISTLQEQLIK